MKKFIIRDWANNICFNNKTFKTFDDAWEYIYSVVDCEDDYQEYFVGVL